MKLYIVVREDLSLGSQMAQSLHAFREFVEYHPEKERDWYRTSNTIVVLGIQDHEELLNLRLKAITQKISFSMFREPDMDNEVTAIAFEPGQRTSEFLAHLNLAGKPSVDYAKL